jgi:hypothetical protein
MSPEDVVQGFLNATTVQGRIGYILDPDRVGPILEAREGQGTVAAPKSLSLRRPEVSGSYTLVRANGVDANETPFQRVFALKQTDAGLKIDWEATVGYNPKPLKTFLARKPDDPASFRVMGDLATYYNFNYVHSHNTHLSIRLIDPESLVKTHGYVAKDSEAGRQLADLLQDGKPHPLTLELKCEGPDREPITQLGANVVAITEVISESWILGQ